MIVIAERLFCSGGCSAGILKAAFMGLLKAVIRSSEGSDGRLQNCNSQYNSQDTENVEKGPKPSLPHHSPKTSDEVQVRDSRRQFWGVRGGAAAAAAAAAVAAAIA